jgi:hypothetical protein
LAALLAVGQHPHHVGVGKPGGQLCLTVEALDELLDLPEVEMQQLHRHHRAIRDTRPVHRTHAALAELLQDLVTADR